MKTILTLTVFFSMLTFSETNQKNDFSFLEGTWKVEFKENYETWERVNDKELKGKSYTLKNQKKIIAEFLELKENEGKTVYTAVVMNQNDGKPVDFVLNKDVKGKFSFENLTHDFPKKIQYTLLDEKTLFVEVLGENDKGFSYRMIKQ
jgi:hypothetical protein